MGITAFIPAKMTSKRLPRKNMLPLAGRPLLYYSVKAAQLAKNIDNIVVSSEDDEVFEFVNEYNVAVHKRSKQLSEPQVSNLEVMAAWYNSLKEKPELVILLQPTHPLRDPKDIDNALVIMKNKKEVDSLFSVVPENALLGIIEEGLFKPEFPLPRNKQAEPKRYRNTGSFYIFRPSSTFLTAKPFGERMFAYILERPEFEKDIDTQLDFDSVNFILKRYETCFDYFYIK